MKRKILVVDDNELNRDMVHEMLSLDYTILEADNGIEALQLMERNSDCISAVLLDIMMPKMNGYEVLEYKAHSENIAQIPVIVMTGSTEEGAEVKALMLGANDYIMKPYNPEIMKHRLSNTISLREKAAIINAIKTDALTGLYNRSAFLEIVGEKVKKHDPGHYVLACFDVDKFKVINDQYGNNKGDEVLKYLARLFQEGFQECGGICARITADHFAILYPKEFMHSDKLKEIQHQAMTLDGSMLPITFSVGRYIIDDLMLTPSAMYDRAAMARTSVKGRYDVHVAIYDESMRNQILQKQEIVSEMNPALKNHQFEVWFQPQYDHGTKEMIGAEALVRWRHLEKGLISPALFIPIFEENGFIYELDQYVWEQACICLRGWMDQRRKPVPISVNVSRYDIFRDDLFETITGLVQKYRIPSSMLRLEITESAFATSWDQIIHVVSSLQDYGFKIEIDDFGSGYSSLNTLKDVYADVLKLDMRFLEGEDHLGRGGCILESIIKMSKQIGTEVIAEGVETMEQADFLDSVGCPSIQGYLYARPMPQKDYEELLDRALSLNIPEENR